jgi:hypothetical protein
VSREDPDATRIRARLLAALNHDLRAAGAHRHQRRQRLGRSDAMENEARRQLEWLSDLQECALRIAAAGTGGGRPICTP